MAEVFILQNQTTDLQIKRLDWFLYDKDLHNERVK